MRKWFGPLFCFDKKTRFIRNFINHIGARNQSVIVNEAKILGLEHGVLLIVHQYKKEAAVNYYTDKC